MSLRIIFDIFSGRPNPEMMLNDTDSKAFLNRLGVGNAKSSAGAQTGIEGMLGYRGLVVEQSGSLQAGLAQRFRVTGSKLFSATTTYQLAAGNFEDALLSNAVSTHAAGISDQLAALIRSEAVASAASAGSASAQASPGPAPPLLRCPCAPIYEPTWWNDAATGGARQFHNNCYNYACNYRTDTYAQPGRAGGTAITSISCDGVKPAVISDALASYSPPSSGLQCPGKGDLAAMVIWPNFDFHWYRLGSDGFWTHKPGSNPVTNLDNSGRVIVDPRTADRGRYTDFCSFMVVMHGHVKLQ